MTAELHLIRATEPDPPTDYMRFWEPTPAPARGWEPTAWVERTPNGTPGTIYTRRSEHHATCPGGVTIAVAELNARVEQGTADVLQVTSVAALAREVYALRRAACYPLGFHADGDECDSDVEPITGLCPHVTQHVATGRDAALRYLLCTILNIATTNPHTEMPALIESLRHALAGDLDPSEC